MTQGRKRHPRKTAAPPTAESSGARAKIQAAALRLFAEKGLEAVSVRDIAKATKTNVSLVSYYFGGKEGLYHSILEEHALDVSDRMIEAIGPFRERPMTKELLAEAIRTIATLLVEVRSRNVEMSLLMQRERLSGLPHGRRIYEEIMAPLGEQIVGIIVRAQKKGVVRKDLNARSFFVAMLESILGYFILHDCRLTVWKDAYRVPRDNDKFIEFIVRLYTEGITA